MNTKSINEIAKALYDIRTTQMSPFIQPGVITELLGSDGYRTALERRWIVAEPDDSGLVHITNDMTKAEEIKAMAETCIKNGADQCKKPSPEEKSTPEKCPKCGEMESDCECDVNETRRIVTGHAHRPLYEWAAPGMGGSSTPASTTPAAPSSAPAPSAATSQAGRPAKPPGIGDDVMVTEDGQLYQGKIQSVGNDGNYVISFGSKKPRQNKAYTANEVRTIKDAQPNPTP